MPKLCADADPHPPQNRNASSFILKIIINRDICSQFFLMSLYTYVILLLLMFETLLIYFCLNFEIIM